MRINSLREWIQALRVDHTVCLEMGDECSPDPNNVMHLDVRGAILLAQQLASAINTIINKYPDDYPMEDLRRMFDEEEEMTMEFLPVHMLEDDN